MRRTVWMAASLLATALVTSPAHADGETAGACAPPPAESRTPLAVDEAVADASPGLTDTSVRWTRWTSLVTYGDQAALAGQVVAGGAAVASAPVDLYEREAGAAGWELVASTRSDPDTGVFEFGCLAPDPTTDYRAVYDGDLYHRESSGDRRVRVARSVPDRMRQVTPLVLRYAGSVGPHERGTRVLLQTRTCRRCSWRSIDRDVTDRRSRWSFRIDASRFTGSRWFRATVPASDGYVRSLSERVWSITSR